MGLCFTAPVNEDLGQLKQRLARLELLYQVGNVIHSTLDPQEALNLILGEAVRLTQASSGSVVLVNPTTGMLEIEAGYHLPADAKEVRLRIGQGITGWVAKTGRPARVGDVGRSPHYVRIRPNTASELAVPLEVEGEVRGVLNVDSDRLDAFSEDDQQLLQAFANQAARVIQNTWLYEQIRLKARMFEGLASVSSTINSTLSLNDALQVIARETYSLMGAKVVALHLLDETETWLDLKACHGAGQAYLKMPRLNAHESFVGVIVRRRKPMQVDNVQASSHYQNQEMARQEGLMSLVSVPLVFADQTLGALSVYKETTYVFSNEEIRVLSALAELSAIALEKARLYERIVQVEDQLRQSEKLSALGLLAAEVAHEIRNPLTVIKMLFHSLELRFPEDDPRSKDTRIIEEKMDLLNRIVERILNFARNSEPRFGPVNLNEIIHDLALITRHKLRAQGVRLILETQPDLPEILGDSIQLEQAFLNLMLNAVEAMPQGGEFRIESGQHPGSQGVSPSIRVRFRDTGEGMSEDQKRQAFTSILNSTKKGGTGLGLAIVKQVIQTHRGDIQVHSELGKGTTFELVLPCSREQDEPMG